MSCCEWLIYYNKKLIEKYSIKKTISKKSILGCSNTLFRLYSNKKCKNSILTTSVKNDNRTFKNRIKTINMKQVKFRNSLCTR